jgi:hypothetical protein
MTVEPTAAFSGIRKTGRFEESHNQIVNHGDDPSRWAQRHPRRVFVEGDIPPVM